MPYVQRNGGGAIIAIFAQPQPGFAEEFAANPVLPPPPEPLNMDLLNAILISRGSILRALALVMFAEVNKLRVINGDPVYTLAQFRTALESQMTPP